MSLLTNMRPCCLSTVSYPSNQPMGRKPAGSDTAKTLRRLSQMRSWSELECDEDFLGTTGRREVQLAHKQEAAEATNTMGLPVYPPPYRMISHFTHSHLCLSSRVPLLILPSQVAPSLLQHHCCSSQLCSCFSVHILICSQQLQSKQEVINLWSVPFKRETNCWRVSLWPLTVTQ